MEYARMFFRKDKEGSYELKDGSKLTIMRKISLEANILSFQCKPLRVFKCEKFGQSKNKKIFY